METQTEQQGLFIQNQEENKKFVDMSQEELKQSITEQENFIYNIRIREYDLNEIEQIKKDIARQNELIKEKKQQYKQSIKLNEERIKESKKSLKVKQNYLNLYEETINREKHLLSIIKEIKEKLSINPNYYKEVLKE
jgi:hypothetical protein